MAHALALYEECHGREVAVAKLLAPGDISLASSDSVEF